MLIDEWGSALEVERRTHISNSTISRYLSGRLPRMNESTWNVLVPHLMKYMPQTSGCVNVNPVTPFPPKNIFQKIIYDEMLSSDDKIKFLRMIVPPPLEK